MGEPGRTDLGEPPGGSSLIDADDDRRPSRLPVVAGALLASALLLAVLARSTRAPDVPAQEAHAERSFLADAPAPAGATAPALEGELQLEIPEGIGGSPFLGDVLIGAVVAPDGSCKEAVVVRSLDPALDAIARRAVSRARFRPARSKEGAAIEGRVVLPVHFEPF